MDFKTYYSDLSREEREKLADSCETTVGQLRNVAYGRRCGESLAINIERETKGIVRCEEIRPDVDWAYLRNTPVDESERAS